MYPAPVGNTQSDLIEGSRSQHNMHREDFGGPEGSLSARSIEPRGRSPFKELPGFRVVSPSPGLQLDSISLGIARDRPLCLGYQHEITEVLLASPSSSSRSGGCTTKPIEMQPGLYINASSSYYEIPDEITIRTNNSSGSPPILVKTSMVSPWPCISPFIHQTRFRSYHTYTSRGTSLIRILSD